MTDISVIIPVNDIRQLSDLFFTQWYEQTVKMSKFELIVITSSDKQSKFINHLYQKTLHLKPNDLEVHFFNENIKQSRAKAMNLLSESCDQRQESFKKSNSWKGALFWEYKKSFQAPKSRPIFFLFIQETSLRRTCSS